MIDRKRQFSFLLYLIAVLWFVELLLVGCKSRVEQSAPTKIEKSLKAKFVARQLCIDCQEDQYKELIGSHHDLAMDVATDETVLEILTTLLLLMTV